MDINSAGGRAAGLTDDQILDLNNHANSPHYSVREKLSLELADAVTANPADVSDELFARLSAEFTYPQVIELGAAAAFENYRSRFNRVFAVESAEFSQGAACPMPGHLMPKK
jgi:alkylhydroperoxidase family enzyme